VHGFSIVKDLDLKCINAFFNTNLSKPNALQTMQKKEGVNNREDDRKKVVFRYRQPVPYEAVIIWLEVIVSRAKCCCYIPSIKEEPSQGFPPQAT